MLAGKGVMVPGEPSVIGEPVPGTSAQEMALTTCHINRKAPIVNTIDIFTPPAHLKNPLSLTFVRLDSKVYIDTKSIYQSRERVFYYPALCPIKFNQAAFSRKA